MLNQTKRLAYPSDLSDKEWELLKPHIPDSQTNRDRKRVHPYHEILNAIFYLLRSGCAWRMLPHEFPPWKTVYHYFRLWRLEGIRERINAAQRTELRVAIGREPEPSAAIIDSQSIKTTETPGTGLLLAVVVHAANIQDRDGAKLVLEQVNGTFSRLQLIWADAAYAGQLID